MTEDQLHDKIDILKFKRNSFLQKINFLYSKSQTFSISEAHPDELNEFKARCEKIHEHYDTFNQYQNELVESYIQLKETAELDLVQEQIEEVDNKYFFIIGIKDKLKSYDKCETLTDSSPTSMGSSLAKLPKISLPIFDGLLKEWPNFRDLYISLVHSNPSLHDIEKYHYLAACTKGEPNSLVRSLPISADNYKIVWAQLIDRYDNKRLLASQYVDEIMSLPNVTVESPKLLRGLLDVLSENTNALKAMNIPCDLGEFIILQTVLKKLDKHTRQLFERTFAKSEFPSLADLLEFLRNHCKCLVSAQQQNPTYPFLKPTDPNFKRFANKPTKPALPQFQPKSFHIKAEANDKCLFCSQNHIIYKCIEFAKLSPIERRDFIKSKEACYNCLSSSHMLNKCTSTASCRKCNSKRHHTSLHQDSFCHINKSAESNISNVSKTQNNNSTIENVTSLVSSSSPNVMTLLGTALIHIEDKFHNFHLVRALVDPGSQSSFITNDCVNKLCLPRHKFSQPIVGLSQTSVPEARGSVLCIVKPRSQTTPKLETKAIILNRITSYLPAVTVSQRVKEFFKDWDLADPNFHCPGPIDFLIGADLMSEVFDGGRSTSPTGFPTPFHTIFGWLLIGKTNLNPAKFDNDKTLVTNLAISDYNSLDSSLKRFWEIEEPPNIKVSNPDDDFCEELFKSTHFRDPSGRYTVKLPFKSENLNLGQSYNKSYQCLISQERRFQKDPTLQRAYIEFMEEYETLGHMSKLSVNENPIYFIPHHGIFKKSNSKPKLRVVFNASATTDSGKSLNDELLIGPKLQNDICQILSRFRLHPFVFSTDICKMYRQILIHEDDRKYQAILWRESPDLPIDVYLLNTVTYGVSSSPYLALRTLHQLAYDEGDKYPEAAKAVLNDMFVDDCLTGTDTLESCLELKNQLSALMSSAGFELRKWCSNSSQILMDVPSEHKEFSFDPDKHQSCSVKVLGLKWRPENDILTYDVPTKDIPSTKRGLLSYVSCIFDPLGLVSPVVFFAKQLMQQLWTLGLDWDDILPEDILSQWNKFCEELPQLENLTIPRFVIFNDALNLQLHGFCDASEKGYSCCVYLRSESSDGKVLINLLISKSKVAPLKKLTIPKLELSGAYLLCKVIRFYKNTLQNTQFGNISIFAWTDSTVVLNWIRTSPHLLKTFVGNRVAEIQDTLNPSQWFYVPSRYNPADCASRGLLPSEIVNHSLWWHGPEWLLHDVKFWPPQDLPLNDNEDVSAELRPSMTHTATSEVNSMFSLHIIERFSSFANLQRCIAWLFRFIRNCQDKHIKCHQNHLTFSELNSTTKLLVRLTQNYYFKDDFEFILKKKPCKLSIQKLNPFIDQDGIIRVGGRLKNATIDYNAKHPMLLPKEAHLTRLIIEHYHKLYLHAGPHTLQSLLMRQFWIISARQKIRHCISKCITCVKIKATTPQPYMANLPKSRLRPSRPFLSCGVDFGGPFYIKSDKKKKPQVLKSYICLFVCMTTKAIHLELVSSLSTDAFLAAFTRFFSRRGLPIDIYSDQATNFVGANKEIKELYLFLNSKSENELIIKQLHQRGVTWHFNPPQAPHFGGIWEAGIKSTKYHLKRVVGEQILTFEELYTVLTKIEAILNSRPLCQISTDPQELDTLTPGHFLVGGPLSSLPEPDLTSKPLNRISRWHLIQKTTQHFWNRWSQEYLHSLQQRVKWTKNTLNLREGDVVLIKEQNVPPMTWLLGRVIKTHPGEDGIVRVATLKTKIGIIKRPVVKLCVLPVT